MQTLRITTYYRYNINGKRKDVNFDWFDMHQKMQIFINKLMKKMVNTLCNF